MAMPEISKMLTISTGHVSSKTISALEEEAEMGVNGLVVYDKCYGFIIYIPESFDQISDDLRGLLQYAHDLNCDILCLDADGPRIPYLKWYTE